jgi:hypothetical protein
MYILKILFVLLFALLAMTIGSCNKEEDCYNENLQVDGYCTGLCWNGGVCGCDGRTYCNECIANSQGIRVISDKPCK